MGTEAIIGFEITAIIWGRCIVIDIPTFTHFAILHIFGCRIFVSITEKRDFSIIRILLTFSVLDICTISLILLLRPSG